MIKLLTDHLYDLIDGMPIIRNLKFIGLCLSVSESLYRNYHPDF